MNPAGLSERKTRSGTARPARIPRSGLAQVPSLLWADQRKPPTRNRTIRLKSLSHEFDRLLSRMVQVYYGRIKGSRRRETGPSDSKACRTHATTVAERKSTRLNSSHLGISYAVFC